jgi:hypothetical protein
MSLAEWIKPEKALYALKINEGKIPETMSFDEWINNRYSAKLNADGSAIKSLLTATSKISPISYTAPIQVKNTVLGMKPLVFYSVAGAITLVVGTLIYSYYKNKK